MTRPRSVERVTADRFHGSYWAVNDELKINEHSVMLHHSPVNSFSTRLLSSCIDEYAHTYISTYSVSSDHVS